ILDRITAALGGRAAEEVVFGKEEITTGAANDLRQVTAMARQMVTRYGMSEELGPISLEGQNTEVFLGAGLMMRSEYSDAIAARIDREVRQIVEECYQKALQIIQTNRTVIDRVVDILIDRETISGDEFRQIVAEYTAVPEKERYVPQL
ncbi:MAG: cell division protein FtsH, partial [Pseudanabaenaceae cyanobacterium]